MTGFTRGVRKPPLSHATVFRGTFCKNTNFYQQILNLLPIFCYFRLRNVASWDD